MPPGCHGTRGLHHYPLDNERHRRVRRERGREGLRRIQRHIIQRTLVELIWARSGARGPARDRALHMAERTQIVLHIDARSGGEMHIR